jgi:Aspartyl/Asparaginyl beta-hydroxylase
MKNRKQLPCWGYLKDWQIDMPALFEYLKNVNLFNFDSYNDIRTDANGSMKDFVIANEYCHTNFFKEDEANMGNSDKFRHVMLTEFDKSKSRGAVEFKYTNIYERTKRLDPTSPNYLPEADELNYTVRTKYAQGELAKIMDMFTSKVTRTRLAYVAGNHELKAHVDYDPTYICRYHIPIITNPSVKMYMKRNGQTLSYHMPADGRVYFFNTGVLHWVVNKSTEARLHLIIDVHGQSELDNLVSLDEQAEILV